MDSELITQIMPHLNEVCSHLVVGNAWHTKAANECRKFYITRGWGQWHDAEAACDNKSFACLTKLMRDNFKQSPVINTTSVAKAFNYTMADFEAFKKHHDEWIEREQRFISSLNNTRALVVDLNFSIYEQICCLLNEVQNEALRADWVRGSCTMTGWEPHDVKVTSRWLHKYFECEYDGGLINFNIG